ncbi:MAG: cyclic nucleotide-binding domain-containing protein [Desulfatibacillum sp.]|nr:cyclic nucleotide-binding domain-containing protein [Desulfatibacillum sp.]
MSNQTTGIVGESKITDRIIDGLSAIPLFDGLSSPDLRTVARHMHLLEVEEGELVFEEGEPGDYVCFVTSGSLNVIKESSTGERATLTTLSRGRSIGEMALIDEFPRSATVIAKTPAALITLSRKNFNLILANHPQAGIPVLKGISRLVSMNLRKTSGQLADLMLPFE